MFKILSAFIQNLINITGDILKVIIQILPDSPFVYITSPDSSFSELLSKINYFIPVYEFVAIIQAWLVAVAIYYLYSVIARWSKLIQ